ncbi:kinase-like domain-containing protein [Fomitopsis serialis]|uniref:kinase-like domain-containing protein n=1 Tax=Fomitopsis serialis TaxID=139415 RepID=UPI0020079F64|nr:kinase-like domain-containing protein [Neoantrodia serialis]KAH9919031.1 kinase-like domain-containing protein [Neoantrodia serialis]
MDSSYSSLQVPDSSQAGPSRHAYRPASIQPTTTSSSASPSSSKKRASHTVVTGQREQEEQPSYRDIYAHPAALEYAAAHPKRTIPKFGPYLLLQTLGEGEFGKVKLGLHMQWGEEVAVKLMRRGNIDSSVRMSKVEREIEVLKSLKHPNIVRLYDVIETDKYIGIILEYASGGELFDHILAHRYLREKDACKLFSQLISGVWYIHQKKIVHRDLKLENLLLDRHRNVIITDFGFANRFEHRSDDLMQTSCGSPCYAAPELVISDGLYVGSAVDIWSCGVILYAMLAGYLPFDDDPANPDGDNINLLYKYIVNTPLSFPDYISAEARDLLSIMLVPDPSRRADLPTIMAHRWLAPCVHNFNKSVADLERAAIEQHHQKRLAYQRQMKQAVQTQEPASKIARSQSSRTDGYSGSASVGPPSRSRSNRDHAYSQQAQPEYLYETSPDASVYSTAPSASRRAFNSTIVLPTSTPMVEDDPFAPSPTGENDATASAMDTAATNGTTSEETRKINGSSPPVSSSKTSPDGKRKGGMRHTIQVEYGESDGREPQHKSSSRTTNGASSAGPSNPEKERSQRKASVDVTRRSSTKALPSTPSATVSRDRSETITQRLVSAQSATAPPVAIEVTGPPVSPGFSPEEKAPTASEKTDSASSKQSRHRKGLSIDKIGISKLFGASPEQPTNGVQRAPSQSKKNGPGRAPSTDAMANGKHDVGRRPSTLQVPVSPTSPTASEPTATLSPDGSISSKKSRRNTLTVMVEPLSRTIKQRTKGRTAETPVKEKAMEKQPSSDGAPAVPPKSPVVVTPATPQYAQQRGVPPTPVGGPHLAVPASTVKASRVMQWFRSKSKGKNTDDEAEKGSGASDIEVVQRDMTPSSSGTMSGNVAMGYLTTPTSEYNRSPVADGHPQRSASTHNESPHVGNSLADRVRNIGTGAKKSAHEYPDIRRHHGPLDQTTVTTHPPPEVMKHVKTVLEGMGVEIHIETDYKYRCVRPKRRRVGLGLREGSVAAFSMVGSAASNGVDKRGLPQPPQSYGTFSGTGGMLRGLLMRRQSSQVSTNSLNQNGAQSYDGETSPDALIAAAVPGGSDVPVAESVYGDSQQDQGDEIRFSVELTRIDRLDDTYSLDIRRLKGNLRSYKFVYDTLRNRADLQRAG